VSNSIERLRPGDGQTRRIASVQALLALTTLEGLLAVGAIFATQSMERNAFILGFSLARILVGLSFLVLVIVFAGGTLRAYLKPGWTQRIVERLDVALTLNERRLPTCFLALMYTFIVGTYVLLVFRGGYVSAPAVLLRVAVDRFVGGTVWIVLVPLQLSALMVSWYSGDLRQALFRSGRGYLRPALFLVLTASTLQWITLALRVDWLYEIQGWFWLYAVKRLRPSHGYLVLAVLVALAVAGAILRRPTLHARNLMLCIGLAFILQAGFGFAQGQGFESMRLKYVNTPLSDEMRLACEFEGGVLGSVRDYEASHGRDFWLGTKPPGFFAFYLAFRALTATIRPEILVYSTTCFDVLSRVAAFVMPLLASLVVVPLYGLERLLSRDDGVHVSGLLYACVPSVLLMPLIPDQFLFPLLFMVSVAVLAMAMVNRSFLIGALAGIFFYLSLFVSFSLLPLMGLGLAWIAFEHFWGKGGRGGTLTMPVLGLCTGVAAAWVALFLAADYNPIVRMVAALEYHRHLKEIANTPASVLTYALLNSVEFAVWNGFALITLLVGSLVRSVTVFVRRQGEMRDSLGLAYGAAFLGLLVGGQTEGEVGRLWIFLVPVAWVLIGSLASRLLNDQSRSVRMVMAFQLITASLMFLNMDFR